ncbi:probable UDP-N-acetylglucosamine--peptide N-acetylglucosaminyltransferase SEC [Olea europaea var. sylvestris]|uniref:probable UDP-N-acetylglucosamine--peptide N-acetylglucosaminyltransferase SEC n=1 Tax=Olea europaea var. sylvestris TaxID=158386 RepID=UPI000C1D0D71|nr:probable UDP-N-acetylglucosamine--peptide N-acetylglucosaminyltransferase SEC [Olea europaea var. sylvestris]
MLSLQSDPRQYNVNMQQAARVQYNFIGGDQHRDDSSFALASGNIKPDLSREVDEDTLLTLAHQSYKAGNYKQALEHSKAVFERNPRRTDNLLLLGAVYYQLHDFDMCIAKNEEALRVDPHFAECYGNMANAWKEKGNIDVAIRYYMIAIEVKENVEVFCYALSPNDGTEWRLRIQSEAEHFIDVSSMSSDMIARMINEDQIQILINLNGYTKGARNELFAMQPAPIQVSYMGFPGTTGATYIHYLVTDEFVSPMRYSHIYSEKLVHLPHCYFVNDYKQKNRDVLDPNCQPKRSHYGLPEDKFIFACFNQLYKMDPEIFTTWCNILKRVPNSALWLLRFPAAGEMRLRAHAAAQGVRPDQIIFTDVAMKQEHIRRSALADLFLDTPLCNAHTTGTDVLWAGLPMITLPLEKMATRVAGSLCLATGLGEEMIVNSMREYEEKAVLLASNRMKLQDLTNKLKAARYTCPLFDTSRWVRNLERAYFKMWSLYSSGQHPEPFKVTENNSEFPYDR